MAAFTPATPNLAATAVLSLTMRSNKSISAITVVQSLFVLCAVIWFLFGARGLATIFDGTVGQPNFVWLISALMLVNALVFLLLAWVIGKRRKNAYYLALAFLMVNIFLTLTDEFGPFDLVVLLIYLIITVLLIASRSRFRLAGLTG